MNKQGTISALNAATFPAWTPNSVVGIYVPKGGNSVLTIATEAGLVGTLRVSVSLNGKRKSFAVDTTISNIATGATGMVNPSGEYKVNVPPGLVYVECSAYTSGSSLVTLSLG